MEGDAELRAGFAIDDVDLAGHRAGELMHDCQADSSTDSFTRKFGF